MLPTYSKERKERPIARGVLDYFPDAVAAVAHVSYIGNKQHNPGEEMHWSRDKSSDHADCIARHLTERGTIDTDGLRHSAKLAWRALANLQLEIEAASNSFDTADPTNREIVKQIEAGEFLIKADRLSKIHVLDGKVVVNDPDAIKQQVFESCHQGSKLTPFEQRVYAELAESRVDASVANLIARGTTPSGGYNLQGRVYIAGPMRGYPDANFPMFDQARDLFSSRGYMVINPADIDRAANMTAEQAENASEDPRVFIDRDYPAIRYLLTSTDRDALVVLPGWERSTGGFAEVGLARWIGLKIIDATTMKPLDPEKFNGYTMSNAFASYLRSKQ
jgi:hypothetical protein